MKKSEKLSLVVSVILFVFAALFSIALLSQLFGAGGNTAFHSLGALLLGAYGAGSALIPAFLLAAGILSFLPTWSIRRWLMLASSIVPFFTIIITEKFCAGFSREGDLLGAVKIGVAVVICVLCLILEYLSCCIAADSLDRWIFEHFSSDDSAKDETEEKAETSAIDSLSHTDEPKGEDGAASAENPEKAEQVHAVSENAESAKAESENEENSVQTPERSPAQNAQNIEQNEGNPEDTESAAEVPAENSAQESDAAEENALSESEETVKAEEPAPAETAAVTTAMFSVSEDEIERARQAEQAELQKKKLTENFDNAPTVVADSEQTVVADKPITTEDDSFVIVPVAEDEAAFITDDAPEQTEIEPHSNVIDLSGNTDYFAESEMPSTSVYAEEPLVPPEEKKPSVFDKAIEAVDERSKLAQTKTDSLDADFFDIDMNEEDDDERAAREEREKTMFAYEDRPLVMERLEPVTVGEFDQSVSEPLNPVFEKMEQDVQASLPEIELPEPERQEIPESAEIEQSEADEFETAQKNCAAESENPAAEIESQITENNSVGEPTFDDAENVPEQNERAETTENPEESAEPRLDETSPRHSLLQTAMQMKDALNGQEPSAQAESTVAAAEEPSVENDDEKTEIAFENLENSEIAQENAFDNDTAETEIAVENDTAEIGEGETTESEEQPVALEENPDAIEESPAATEKPAVIIEEPSVTVEKPSGADGYFNGVQRKSVLGNRRGNKAGGGKSHEHIERVQNRRGSYGNPKRSCRYDV